MDLQDVFNRQFELVYRVAMIYTKNAADAEGAAQSVFLKLIEKKVEFTDENHEKAWFITATRNHCKDMLRSFWRREVDLGEIPEQPDSSSQSTALSVMMNLPPKYREVLYMYYYEGYSVREISKILHRKESTVQTQLSAGREKLKPLLIEEGFYYE